MVRAVCPHVTLTLIVLLSCQPGATPVARRAL